jgi:hypothetical protein
VVFCVILQLLTRRQYACAAASWSARIQELEVDVKQAESIEEVMRLAAPCSSALDPSVSTYPCAAGINTSSVFVFSEITMLDAMVNQSSAAAVRALPYGIFALLVSQDDYLKHVGGSRGDGADASGISPLSAAYHKANRNIFTSNDLQLQALIWPQKITDSVTHSSWLTQAAVDAWLNIVPFPYILDAHAVVDARTSSTFIPNASHATGANGRQCTLASLHIDRALYYLEAKNYPEFLFGAWFLIDLSSVCLFSALNLQLQHPARDRIEANFQNIYWKLHLHDRNPLPPMAGCDEYVRRAIFGHNRATMITIRAATLRWMASALQTCTDTCPAIGCTQV